MNSNREQFYLSLISGARRGPAAGAMRLGLAAMEPFYAGATILRNRLYDAGIFRTTRLSRPVISVGNLTTGGTGKTPMVRWLAGRLRGDGKTVAILSRGYKSARGELGDEQIMLDRMLNAPSLEPVILRANPNRIAGAAAALHDRPDIDLFLLDDAFQHRRVARDLDIVLLNATDPFGFNHVLPRGLMREPISGIRRAGAMVITHADAVSESVLAAIEQRVRQYHLAIPIYRAVHANPGLRTPGISSALPPDRTLNDLRRRRFFAFCGIGNPAALDRQLRSLGSQYAGKRWFPDHHRYSQDDLEQLRTAAAAQNADLLLTTEKDWVKVAQLGGATDGSPEIWRIDVELRFLDGGGDRLYQQVLAAINMG